MNLRLRSEDPAGVCRIRAEGDLRSVAEPRDLRDLEAMLGHHCRRRTILLDLQDAPHIDSSGISRLVHWHRSCRAAGGLLVLHSVPPAILAALRLLGLDREIHLAADEAAALAVAQGGRP
jgi:anti-sigma B factor antagonist